MRFRKNLIVPTLAGAAVLFLNSCFAVQILEDVKNPDKYFKKAYDDINKVHRIDPQRKGDCRQVHILVYDYTEMKLIRVKAPFWLIDKCPDFDDQPFERETVVGRQFGFDWKGIKDLKKIGPGLLLEVDGQGDRVLIWID
ncbi:MAG: hypothetical protein ACOC57_07655 [Acidobacteriota bacterium]